MKQNIYCVDLDFVFISKYSQNHGGKLSYTDFEVNICTEQNNIYRWNINQFLLMLSLVSL